MRLRYKFASWLSCAPLVFGALALANCSSAAPPPGSNVAVGATPPANWPAPRRATSGPPQIQKMWFSTLDVPLGSDWDGEFVASTNTAGINVETNLFAIHVPQLSPGRFRFHIRMVDVPVGFVRGYPLRIIAHNAAGTEVETDIPFRISGRR
jgi:hypothetical protein